MYRDAVLIGADQQPGLLLSQIPGCAQATPQSSGHWWPWMVGDGYPTLGDNRRAQPCTRLALQRQGRICRCRISVTIEPTLRFDNTELKLGLINSVLSRSALGLGIQHHMSEKLGHGTQHHSSIHSVSLLGMQKRALFHAKCNKHRKMIL